MARTNYGFSKVNRSFNAKSYNNASIKSSNRGTLSSARVISVVLDDTHPRFKELGEWLALGAIEYDPTDSPSYNSAYPVAYPLNTNIKNFPLIKEVVTILSTFSSGVDFFENDIPINNSRHKTYYVNTINVWNSPHHNGYAFNTDLAPSTQNKSYSQTQAGDTNTVSDTPVEINLGKTFKERSNIHPLLPFEGDIIYEGRWGNSIRLGSTVKDSSNGWSSTGENGDPITVIRNGQGKDQSEEGWIPIVENINNDDSSIYITSTQNLPLNAISTDYTSYGKTLPKAPNEYAGPQIVLNSGRLMFNAYSDHILLSSANSINLNSVKTVNIDTKKLIVDADNIYLGEETLANQHLMLGDNTVEFLRTLTKALKDIATYLKTLQSDPVVDGKPATFNSTLLPEIAKLCITLETLESQYINVTPPVLISQRNFTL